MSKIIRLESENVKRLRAVEITPDGELVVIGGRNAQGKSSVLDSIMYALGGKGKIPGKPVRQGETSARVVVELDDMVITRTMMPEGSGRLVVESRDGARYQSPQAVLDKLTGSLSFDPLGFTRLKPAEQLEEVRAVVGLDTSEIDDEHDKVYQQRTETGREQKRLDGQLASMPHFPEAPDDEVSIAALIKTMQDIERTNDAARGAAADVERTQDRIERGHVEIQRIEEQLRKATDLLEQLQSTLADQEQAAARYESQDTIELQSQITEAETINAEVRANRQRAAVEHEAQSVRAAYVEQTGQIEALKQRKSSAVAAARFPVEGLSFGDEGLLYQGLPFGQASGAEQLRVSVAMGLALNPDLRVLLVRDGSLLDGDSLHTLAELAKAADAQVWLERVGTGPECQIIIEDGEVQS